MVSNDCLWSALLAVEAWQWLRCRHCCSDFYLTIRLSTDEFWGHSHSNIHIFCLSTFLQNHFFLGCHLHLTSVHVGEVGALATIAVILVTYIGSALDLLTEFHFYVSIYFTFFIFPSSGFKYASLPMLFIL